MFGGHFTHNTELAFLVICGGPSVNVLKLNLALTKG